MELHKGDLTLLLDRLSKGDRAAEEVLMESVYAELHRLAMARLRSERENHTLQATALVHEAYMRMCQADDIRYQDRAHFFRIAVRLMRRILVDYARERSAEKRNHGAPLLPLENAADISNRPTVDALEVDELLDRLAELSPRQAQVVEMRFYGGLTEEEIALALGKHTRTIRNDWLMARAWFHQQLSAE